MSFLICLDNIPATVTGRAWKEYHEKKKIDKKKQQEEKEERIRQEKKVLKEKNVKEKKKQKNKKKARNESTSEDSDLEVQYAESEDSYDENNDNDYLAEFMKQQKKLQSQYLTKDSSDMDMDDAPISEITALKTGKEHTKGIIPGSYVIVKYEAEHFPGRVENVEGNQYEVSTMVLSLGSSFRWPDLVDKIWYRYENVIEKINKPVCIKRGFFKVKEMEKYLTFIYE